MTTNEPEFSAEDVRRLEALAYASGRIDQRHIEVGPLILPSKFAKAAVERGTEAWKFQDLFTELERAAAEKSPEVSE
jgi:hypothetical protein